MTYEEILAFVTKNIKKTAAKKIENSTAVEFDIYGEGEGAFYIAVKEGVAEIAPYEYYDRDAKIIITADELAKIIKGEKKAEDSMGEGVLMIEGNIEAALDVLSIAKMPQKKAPVKNETVAKKTVKAEKKIVEATKSPKSKVAKDIKK